MRISNETRYPHPVLSPFADDYAAGQFLVDFEVAEDPESGNLTLSHHITLTEPTILELVRSGGAEVGCVVRCPDTYYIRLHRFDFPEGKTSFRSGELIGTVTLRPIIWLKDDMARLSAKSIHPEFGDSIVLRSGAILALDIEFAISVGMDKLASAESIFELSASDSVGEGRFEVVLNDSRISINMHPETLKMINFLREKHNGKAIVMNSCYLPAVMEVLDILRSEKDSYSDRRWYKAFMARCIFKGVDLESEISTLCAAQELLEGPLESLNVLFKGEENG